MKRLLTRKAVRDLIGFSFAHIARFISDPAYSHIGFPKPVRIGVKLLWDEDEVQDWIQQKLDQR